MLSSRKEVRTENAGEVPLVITIYQPVKREAHRGHIWFCSYRIRLQSVVVAAGTRPGMDAVTAVYACYVKVAAEMKLLKRERNITWIGHDFWWVDQLIPEQT